MTSTTAIPPVTSRTVAGPLTTTFTPGPQCSLWSSVFPSGSPDTFVSDFTVWTRIVFNAFTTENSCSSRRTSDFCMPGAKGWGVTFPHFYSPGWVCPQGWTEVATVSSPSTSMVSVSANWYYSRGVILNTLLPDETAIICCPTSYTYSAAPDFEINYTYNPSCTMDVSGPAATSVFTCGDSTGGAVLSSSTSASYYTGLGYVDTIQLNFRPQDKSPGLTSSGASATLPAAGTSSSGSGSESGVRFPVGAIVGICVGIATLMAVVGFLCFLLWRRRRAGGGRSRGDANHGSGAQTEPAQAAGFGLKPELDAYASMVHEMQDTDMPPSVVHEMHDSDVPPSVVHEIQDTNVPPPRSPGPFEMDGS